MLQEIVQKKKERLQQRKRQVPLSRISNPPLRPARDFLGALQSRRHSIIAEFKRSSPSKGDFGSPLTLEDAVTLYNRYAQAVSILTEEDFFGGSLDDLALGSGMSSIPVLRKDFIFEPYQVYESRHYGADALLLIADILSQEEISALYRLAGELGMQVLVEVHSEESLQKALPLHPPLIGINNRNLDDLTIDRNTTVRLAAQTPEGSLLVSESGFSEASHLKAIAPHAGAFLIGTAFMKAEDPERMLQEFIAALQSTGEGGRL